MSPDSSHAMESFVIRDVKFNSPKLKGHLDYSSWAFNAKLYFVDLNLWHIVDADQPLLPPYTPEIRRQLDISLAKLNNIIGPGPQTHLRTCRDGRIAWGVLRDKYRPTNDSAIMAKHVKLDLAYPPRDQEKVLVLLGGCLPQWKATARQIKTTNRFVGTPLKWEYVCLTMIEEEQSMEDPELALQNHVAEVEAAAYKMGAVKVNDRGKDRQSQGKDRQKKDLSKVSCYNCHEKGHFARNCPSKSKNKEGKDNDQLEAASYSVTCVQGS